MKGKEMTNCNAKCDRKDIYTWGQRQRAIYKMYFFFFSLTFVFESESSCRHTNIREKVEVELVGSAVEESWDRGAFGRR